MSGFDGDPFGPPTVDNPFEDPAVQQVAAKQPSSIQHGLEDYNPFADQPPQTTPTVARGASNPPPNYNTTTAQPAVMQPIQENVPPSYSRTPQNLTTADLQRRQEELDRKAQELERREEELRNNATYNVRRNNWPPLPANFCGLEPCFYQDINVEIPVDFQNVVRQLYYLWLFHTILMVTNIFGGLLLLLTAGSLTTFALSVFFLILFTPFSFLCWYRPGYKAFRDDSSFNFMVFFFIFFFQFLITVMQAMGVPDSGNCGLIVAIKTFDHSVGGILCGIVLLSIALGFVAAAAMDIFLLTKVHRIYRSSGASMAKAQAEFTNEFLRNEHVRNAASSAASAAVQSQLNQNNQPRNY